MARVELPAPVVRPGSEEARNSGPPPSLHGLQRDLEARVDGEIRFDAGSRGAYSTDASNYRQVPLGVVVPRTVEAAAEAMLVCRDHGALVLPRGGGTSLGGQGTNAAVVIDCSKYLTHLLSVDATERTCWVEPGIVLDELNAQLAPSGLGFGPQPATHNHCTLGGMIGNNSCGATAQRTGKTVDNVLALEVMLPDGTRLKVSETPPADLQQILADGGRSAEVHRQLRELADRYGDEIRAQFPQIPRRVSGYNLDSLLPEFGFNPARALVGTEGTCVLVLRAKLALMPVVPATAAVLLGYADLGSSGDDVPTVLEHDPVALEGFDQRIISYQRTKHLNTGAIDRLPEGPEAWLLVQFGADTPAGARRKAGDFAEAARRFDTRPTISVYDDEAQQEQLWQIREAALGTAAHVPGLPNMWPGWEDSAVPPERLGEYLRGLRGLYEEFGYSDASLYGHYGQGCVHSRIPFDLASEQGIATFRAFMERAARFVVSLGGSLSGEHGDGQARAELLPVMYSSELITAFAQFKAVFDPGNRMNPGMMAAPYRIDENLRLGAGYSPEQLETHFSFPDDDGRFDQAVLRCVGVGNCRRHDGGVMCPSYMVTREEEDSTRGRARLLFEMLQGHEDSPIRDGWRSQEVHDALDLCLSCKGCKADCPVEVDMATYKAEFLSHFHAGRLRPMAHYSMGWLPLWAALASRVPRVVNALTRTPGVAAVAKAAGGIAPERTIPLFATETFQSWFARRQPQGNGRRGEVVLWPDTFSNSFHPHVAQAAVEVLEDAGWRVLVPQDPVCCGLTWISTGQLDVAQRVLRRTVDVLGPHLRRGTPILGLEPSCTAVFRSDAADLFPHDADVRRLRDQTVTLAELLMDHSEGWQPPRMARGALVQTHCHQHAVMGFDRDADLLEAMGVDADVLDSGCCGLAGNFGFEKGHYEVSEACGERVLFPALRGADRDAAVLADGFSCRTQIEQGQAGGRQGLHLAELLAAALHGDEAAGMAPEDAYGQRPQTPRIGPAHRPRDRPRPRSSGGGCRPPAPAARQPPPDVPLLDDDVALGAQAVDRGFQHVAGLQPRVPSGLVPPPERDAGRRAGEDEVAGGERDHRGEVGDQGGRTEHQVGGGILLDGFAVDLRADPRPVGELVGGDQERPDRGRGLPGLALHPFGGPSLPAAHGDVVGDGVAGDVVGGVRFGDAPAFGADDDGQFAFPVQPVVLLRHGDGIGRAGERAGELGEDRGVGRQLLARLEDVVAVVQSDAEDLLGGRDQRAEIGLGHGYDGAAILGCPGRLEGRGPGGVAGGQEGPHVGEAGQLVGGLALDERGERLLCRPGTADGCEFHGTIPPHAGAAPCGVTPFAGLRPRRRPSDRPPVFPSAWRPGLRRRRHTRQPWPGGRLRPAGWRCPR